MIRLKSPSTVWRAIIESSEKQRTIYRLEPSPSINMSAFGEKRVFIYSLLLAVVTLAFYNPITRNQFIDFDDLLYILKNSHIQSGLTWGAVKWSFTTFYSGNWHPLTWLSHALDYQIFGLNPIGHHYTNLLLHTANVVLLFQLLRRATGFTWSSLVVAALFALHPVNVESVAWAAERKNLLSMFFFLLALHAYDRYGRTGARYLYWLVAAFFVLGLMAKPQIVTLPFVLLLWDYWPLQRMGTGSASAGSLSTVAIPRSFASLVLEKVPLFILAALDSVVTVIAQRAGNTVRTLSEVSVSARVENAFLSYVRYIGNALWPSRLVPMYTRSDHSPPIWQVSGAVALLLLISVLVILLRERRYLLVGWLWFLGTLVPMIGIITVGEQAMADRYAYLPFVGLFVVVVWTLSEVVSKHQISRWYVGATVVVLFILGCLTYRQIGYWRNSETLWRYTLSVSDDNYTAHNNLALTLLEQGRDDEAVTEFRAGKAQHHYPVDQVLALGFYELRVGHPREAIEECIGVLHESNDPKVQAIAYSELGQGYLQLHQYDQATASYQNALRLNPEDGTALTGSGVLELRQGQYSAAVDKLRHAVRVDPTDVNVLLLAQALRRDGRAEEADSAIAQVQKVSSDPSQAQVNARKWLSFAELQPL